MGYQEYSDILKKGLMKKWDKTYIVKKITIDTDEHLVQTWPNCWLFSALNNYRFITWSKPDVPLIAKKLISYWIDITKWNNTEMAFQVICDTYWKTFYKMDAKNNFDYFKLLLDYWYPIVIKRANNAKFLKDIEDNDIANNPIIPWWVDNHYEIMIRKNWKLHIIWQYKDTNYVQEYDRDESALKKSFENWWVYPNVYFIQP